MAEYDKGRYYWIKLTDRFMTSDTVDFLMSQKEGANYVVLYQMLCLKTVNNNGIMARQLGEMIIPYEIEKIQRDCKWFSIDTVRIALELYKKLGLIFENNDGILAISDFDRLIGSQTYGAEKKQLQRAEDKCPPICPPKKEIKTLRYKENREEDIEIDIKEKEEKKQQRKEIESDELFEKFWDAYPKKKAKIKAKEAFKKIKPTPTEEFVNKMIKAIEEQKVSLDWKKEQGQFIPYPSTWLNQGRWEDVPMGTNRYGTADEIEAENLREIERMERLVNGT